MRQWIDILNESVGQIVYHGSESVNITQFDTGRDRQGRIAADARGCICFSTERSFAERYAGKRGRVYAVRLLTDNLGDYLNPEDVKICKAYHRRQKIRSYARLHQQRPDIWTKKVILANWERSNIYRDIEAGAYQYWEHISLWREAGWDGAWMYEKGNGGEGRNVALSSAKHIEMVPEAV